MNQFKRALFLPPKSSILTYSKYITVILFVMYRFFFVAYTEGGFCRLQCSYQKNLSHRYVNKIKLPILRSLFFVMNMIILICQGRNADKLMSVLHTD